MCKWSFSERSYFYFSYVPGSANSQGDFVVWVKTLQEHDERVRKVFLKIRESVKLEKSRLHSWDTLFPQKTFKLIIPKLKEIVKHQHFVKKFLIQIYHPVQEPMPVQLD